MKIYFMAAFALSAGIAGIAKFAGSYISFLDKDFSNPELVLIGLVSWCVFMVFFLSLANSRLNRNLASTTAGFEQFEMDVARRLAGIDTKIVTRKPKTKTDPDPKEIRWKIAPEDARRNIMPDSGETSRKTQSTFTNPTDTSANSQDRTEQRSVKSGHDARKANKQKSDIAKAVRSGQVTSWFEPVVTLPERATRYLDARPYLQLSPNKLLSPDDWLDKARPKSLRTEIDLQMFDQVIALARDLERENRNVGVILRLNWRIASRKENAAKFTNMAEASSNLSNRVLLEITLPEYMQMDLRCRDMIAHLRDLGYSLVLSQCDDVEAVEEAIVSGLFGFVVPDARLLMSPDRLAMFRRSNLEHEKGQERHMEIIARGIENEETAIEMIDHNILLAQGPLFSPARPLKYGVGSKGPSQSVVQ
ncbi:MAG: EAL domain-containing protein [Rhizobiaceae bacterium]